MSWLGGAAIAFSVVIATAGLQSGPRLTGQRLEGARRVCVYGNRAQLKERRIGSGEPCPLYHRERPEEVEFVPASAVRVGETSGTGRTLCVYRFAERDYRTILPALIRCPLTPSAGMRVDAGTAGRGQ